MHLFLESGPVDPRNGARVQRPLCTSTKDPAYPQLYYVEALIGPRTVDTMPMATLDAYRASGVRVHHLLSTLQRKERALGLV